MSLSDPNNQIKPFKGIRSMGRVQTSTSGLNACTGFKHVNKNRTYSTLGWQQVYWSEEPGSNLKVRKYRKYQTTEFSSKIGTMSKYVDQQKVLSKWMHLKTTRILWICQMFGLDYYHHFELLDNCTFRVLARGSSSDPESLSGSATFSKAPTLWNFAGTLLPGGFHAGFHAPECLHCRTLSNYRNSRTMSHACSNTMTNYSQREENMGQPGSVRVADRLKFRPTDPWPAGEKKTDHQHQTVPMYSP